MGEKVSEQIDLAPLTVRVIRNISKTYHCPNWENFKQSFFLKSALAPISTRMCLAPLSDPIDFVVLP